MNMNSAPTSAWSFWNLRVSSVTLVLSLQFIAHNGFHPNGACTLHHLNNRTIVIAIIYDQMSG